MTTPSSDPESLRTFAQLIAKLESGRTHHDLTDAVTRISQALTTNLSRGIVGKAKLTLVLEFALRDGVMEIIPAITEKLPKPNRSRSVYWVTPDGTLSARNPEQMEMPFQVVEPVAREVVTVNQTRDVRAAG